MLLQAHNCKPASFGSGDSRRSFSSSYSESRYVESSSNSQDEIAALKAECKELSSQANKAVEMNVELTSLRNQVRFQ